MKYRKFAAVVAALTLFAGVGALHPAVAGTGASQACEDGTAPPGAQDVVIAKDPVTAGVQFGSTTNSVFFIDFCFSNTPYNTPGSIGGFVSGRIQAKQTAPNEYLVQLLVVCAPDTNSAWLVCNTPVGATVTQSDPDTGSVGYTFTTTVFAPSTSVPIGATGAELGVVSGGPSGTTGAFVGGTCLFVAGFTLPAGCAPPTGAAIAVGDLLPGVSVVTGCAVSVGSECLVPVDTPTGAAITAFRDPVNNTLTVTVLGTTISNDPTGNQPLCVKLLTGTC